MTEMVYEMKETNINDCSNIQKDANKDESDSFLQNQSSETTKSGNKNVFWRIIELIIMSLMNTDGKFRYLNIFYYE